MTTKRKMVRYYHAFTDRRDEYPPTLKEARAFIARWKAEGSANLRIYKVEYPEGYNGEQEEVEDCVFSLGEFPI